MALRRSVYQSRGSPGCRSDRWRRHAIAAARDQCQCSGRQCCAWETGAGPCDDWTNASAVLRAQAVLGIELLRAEAMLPIDMLSHGLRAQGSVPHQYVRR